ncbi:MAG: hypothetical protein IJD45_02185 [Clostridia bacterium]|nr:hypothetical protein [Clostridia bacterium]
MNFINCSNERVSVLMRKAAIFWSENIAEHIASLLRSVPGTTVVLEDFFKEELKGYYQKFISFNENFKKGERPLAYYQEFLRVNSGFINLLERIKFEALSGYPVMQQSIFHYIYESRYTNTIFTAKNTVGNVLITNYFPPFLNNGFSCFYNQMYFWSIIGAMHPSLLLNNNAFYNALNGYSKEFLTEVCNKFNNINFNLSSLKRPVKRKPLAEIFEDFCISNIEYLEFLKAVKQSSPKIFISPNLTRLPESFYSAVDHQINEHSLVEEINSNIEKYLK